MEKVFDFGRNCLHALPNHFLTGQQQEQHLLPQQQQQQEQQQQQQQQQQLQHLVPTSTALHRLRLIV